MKIIVEPGIIDLSKMNIPDTVLKHALSITAGSTPGEVVVEVSNSDKAIEIRDALGLVLTGDETGIMGGMVWFLKKPQTVTINSNAAFETLIVLSPTVRGKLTQILFEGYGLVKSVRDGGILGFETIDKRLSFMSKFLRECFLFVDGEWRMLEVATISAYVANQPDNDEIGIEEDGDDSGDVKENPEQIGPPSYVMPAFSPVPKSFEISDAGAAITRMLGEINAEFVNLNKKIEAIAELAKAPKAIDVEVQLSRIAADPAIEAVNHFSEYLGVRTKPVHFIDAEGVKRSIGRLMIAIPYDILKNGNSSTIKVYNMDRTVEGNQAPHVFGGGDVCFGNVKGMIDNILKMGDLYAAVQAIILFFQHPDEEDEMGDFAQYYPEVD